MLSLLLLAATAQAALNKAAAYSDGLTPHFQFRSSLPASAQKSKSGIAVPNQCLSYGRNKNGDGTLYCPSGSFTAQQVTFADCPDPFQFCQCNDNVNSRTLNIDTLISVFSRLPPALKSNVRWVLSMPSANVWAETYVGPNDVLIFGNAVPDSQDGPMDVFIHETSHALDLGDGSTWNSSTSAWTSAVSADSCVPDSYANNNYVEDFAQVSVVHTWTQLHNNQPPDSTNDLTCMRNQLNYFNSRASLSMTPSQCRVDVKNHFLYGRSRTVPRSSLDKYADTEDDVPVLWVSSDFHGGKGHHPLTSA